MVEIRNMHVEYDHCAVKETYENILNNVVKFSNGVWVSLAIPYVAIRIMEKLARVMEGTLTITVGWISAWS